MIAASLDPAEREKLGLTLIGMVNSAIDSYPSASKGGFKDVMNRLVDERFCKHPWHVQLPVFAAASAPHLLDPAHTPLSLEPPCSPYMRNSGDLCAHLTHACARVVGKGCRVVYSVVTISKEDGRRKDLHMCHT